MRAFVSIDIDSEEVVNNLQRLRERLQEVRGINVVDREKLHITLLFLGDREDEQADQLKQEFTEAASTLTTKSFSCTVKSVGVFPHMNFIKVIWAGASPKSTFTELHKHFSEHVGGVFHQDFVPHVTIGRVRHLAADEKQRLQEVLGAADEVFGRFQVEDVRLKQSELKDDGPVYTDLAVCAL